MVKEWWARSRFLVMRRKPEELDEELQFHLSSQSK